MNAFDDQARYLRSEKDLRPYSETEQRGMVLPIARSGYNDRHYAAVPSLLGGDGWRVANDIMHGRGVTQNEIDGASGELVGMAATGGIAMPRPRGSIGMGGRPQSAPAQATERSLDSLGYYSKALEEAKGLQGKGTFEQYLNTLRNKGVKQAEIDATKLGNAFDPKATVSSSDIVKHLTDNRVGVREKVYGEHTLEDVVRAELDAIERVGNRFEYAGRRYSDYESAAEAARDMASKVESQGALENPTKWSTHSLDPSNPTYRETVLHLPENPRIAELRELRAPLATGHIADPVARAARAAEREAIDAELRRLERPDFQSGHFDEPNIIGHMMTSLNKHEGKVVHTLDQIQSDWGQRIRDGGVRDEAKIAELWPRYQEASNALAKAVQEHTEKGRALLQRISPGSKADVDGGLFAAAKDRSLPEDVRKAASAHLSQAYELKNGELANRSRLLGAEYNTATAAISGHPLVNTTDQWTNTTLRRALQQAIDENADRMAIPSGKTVLSYNPGDAHGMSEFYDKIIPKNLEAILAKLDKAGVKRGFAPQLETPSGMKGHGFTTFDITPAMREAAKKGMPLFANPSTAAYFGLSQPPQQDRRPNAFEAY